MCVSIESRSRVSILSSCTMALPVPSALVSVTAPPLPSEPPPRGERLPVTRGGERELRGPRAALTNNPARAAGLRDATRAYRSA